MSRASASSSPNPAAAPTTGTASGVAQAVTALTEQTAGLVQREVAAGRAELVDKLKANLPGAALAATGALMGVFTLASAHRWVVALLERRLPPASAAFVSLLLFGAAAAGAGVAGVRSLQTSPAPLPTDTARRVAEEAVDVRDGVQAGAAAAGSPGAPAPGR